MELAILVQFSGFYLCLAVSEMHKGALAESKQRQAKLLVIGDENNGLMARVAEYEAEIADYKEKIKAVEQARDQSTATVSS